MADKHFQNDHYLETVMGTNRYTIEPPLLIARTVIANGTR